MAFFDFMRQLSFFQGRDIADLHEEDLDFAKWVHVHRDWRRRLNSFIEGRSEEALDESVICFDDRCDLGKWIHGNGGRYYGDLTIFAKLKSHHADFHRSAGKVVRLYKTEGQEAAAKTLHADFDLHSIRVVGCLETLEKQVKG
jgi:hypothetical protein